MKYFKNFQLSFFVYEFLSRLYTKQDLERIIADRTQQLTVYRCPHRVLRSHQKGNTSNYDTLTELIRTFKWK
jgi:hypothetical protein